MPYATSHGVRIYYEAEGEGPAVVFQTGAGGDLRMWRYAGYTDGLPGFRKILMDQRGRGRSDRPDTIESHRMERHFEDVAAILDDVGVNRCAFWGYSNGILVGLAFGVAYPSRLAALVGTGAMSFQDFTDLPPVDLADLVKQDASRGGVGAVLDRYMAAENESFPPEIDQNVRAGDPLMFALDRAGRRSWRGPLSLYDGFQVPTLILAGEREDTERETERCVARMPRATLHRVPGVGHLGAFSRSELSIPIALSFLRGTLQ
jgi:pimeloyl-ACP methyl ester carboxylesterase